MNGGGVLEVMILPAGPWRKVIVDRRVIAANLINDQADPVLLVTEEGEPGIRAHRVIINGLSSVVYEPGLPQVLDATAWIDTNSELTLLRYPHPSLTEEEKEMNQVRREAHKPTVELRSK